MSRTRSTIPKITPPTRRPNEFRWLPKLAPELSSLGGAQLGPAPFLDPFARARRNPNEK